MPNLTFAEAAQASQIPVHVLTAAEQAAAHGAPNNSHTSDDAAPMGDEIKPGELGNALPAAAVLMLKAVPGQRGDPVQLPTLFTQKTQQSCQGPGYTITRLEPVLKNRNACLSVSYHPSGFPLGVHLHQRRPQALQSAKDDLQEEMRVLQQESPNSQLIEDMTARVKSLKHISEAADEGQSVIASLQRKLDNHRQLMRSDIAGCNELASLRQQKEEQKKAKKLRQQDREADWKKADLRLQARHDFSSASSHVRAGHCCGSSGR